MDIIKSILHVFKKSDNAFKIMHPETESAQITDWNQGIVNTLASTALGTLVSTLTSDSLLATMIQKVLTATGVKYSMGQNGYICFGALFGNLIIQWGESTSPITFPIAFNILYAYEMLHNSSLRHKTLPMSGANDGSRLFFDLWNIQANDYDAAGTAIYIAVGK